MKFGPHTPWEPLKIWWWKVVNRQQLYHPLFDFAQILDTYDIIWHTKTTVITYSICFVKIRRRCWSVDAQRRYSDDDSWTTTDKRAEGQRSTSCAWEHHARSDSRPFDQLTWAVDLLFFCFINQCPQCLNNSHECSVLAVDKWPCSCPTCWSTLAFSQTLTERFLQISTFNCREAHVTKI